MNSLLFLFLLSFSALCSASETSFFSLSLIRIKSFAKSSHPYRRKIAFLLSKPQELIVTLLILNISANLLLQNVVSSTFSDQSSWWIIVGLPLALSLIFGEILPKAFAFEHNEKIAQRSIRIIHFFFYLLAPLRFFLTQITDRLSCFFFSFLQPRSEISRKQWNQVLNHSKFLGILSHREVSFIQEYVQLEELYVKELMQPKEYIPFYNYSQPIEELIRLVRNCSYSSLPVYQDTREKLLGMLPIKQFLFAHPLDKEKLRSLLEPPFFIPELASARKLIQWAHKREEFTLLAVDEYGTIVGIVDQSHLCEALFGSTIQRQLPHVIYSSPDGKKLIVDGRLPLDYLEKSFDCKFPNYNCTITIGGWLIEQWGDIPKVDDTYKWKNFFFRVIEVTQKKIHKVYIAYLNK